MESENGLDTLPLALFGCNTSSSFVCRVGDKLVNDSQAFGFVEGLSFE